MMTKISILELEKATLEGLRNMRVGAPVSEVPVVPDPTALESKILSSTPGKYKCKRCEEECQSMKSLGDHMKVKHPNVQFKCGKCPKAFPFKSALRNHVKIGHATIVHQCTICNGMFLTKQGIDGHRSTKCETPTAPNVQQPGPSVQQQQNNQVQQQQGQFSQVQQQLSAPSV